MKKLLVLLALLLALTLVFIACDKKPSGTDDTTVADQTTEEPTQDVEDPTAAPTDPEETTEEPTEAPTQEDPTDTPTEKPTEKPEDPTEPPATQEPETADPMEPVNVFGPEDIQTVTGGDPSNMTQDCLTLEDGFIHVVPIGPDPYWYPFAGVDGARYVAIRYRTDATGADIQMYIGSTGNGPTDDSTMLRQPVIADSEWHVAIFDTQSLIEAGKYDGKYVSYFRFDALEAGYILDENGQPYKPDGVNYARYTLPEGCSIDVAYIGFFHNEDAAAKYDFEQYPPFAQPGDAGLKSNSFDTFYVNGQMYFPDGGADAKLDEINNTLTFGAASELQNIALRGWIGFNQAIDQFGYYVDNYEFIFGEFKQATEDGVLAAGGEFATRFQINIDLSYLEGDDHFVGFVVKLADGTIVQLREEIVIDLPELPKDITDSFVSDVNSNEVGTTLDASDLSNFFVPELPLAGSGVEANGEGKLYNLTSINDFYTDVNGRYFFKANIVDTNGAGWMFVRGYRVVNSDEIIEKFDPAGGIFKINNYYETDSAGAMGGAGIYARLQGGKLFIMVKAYDPACVTRVANKIYFIEAAGTELTMADNGATVSIMVDGVTYATIALTGSITYGDINEVDPAGEFAEKAVITLKDGTTETIENTLIAATCECQIGAVSRAGLFKFDYMSVGGYSAIEVPALEIETPEEPEPVDPNAPVYVITPEFINSQALSTGGQTFTNMVGSSEVITEDGVTFVKLTANGGDPYVTLINIGSMQQLPQYMAISYRTNTGNNGQFFMGSGAGWSGQGDAFSVNWNEDGNWNNMIVDLAASGLTSINNNIINYCRFDFFSGNSTAEEYIAVEYVAFFNTAEAAENYFNKLHGIDTPEEPKPEEPVENVVINLATINGYKPTNNYGYDCPIIDIGYNEVYLLGDIDLSKYSQAIIKYSYDGDTMTDRTPEQCWTDCGRAPIIGFTTINKCFGYANVTNADAIEAGFYADLPYTTGNWSAHTRTAVIDLTDVTYSGPLYLSAYNPWGRGIAVVSIELVPAPEVAPEEPEVTEPQEPETNEPETNEPETEEPTPDEPAPHEHAYDAVVTAPTCQAGGYTTYTCACGDSYTADETAKVGHEFYANTCAYCGGVLPTYTLWSADKAIVKHQSFDQLYVGPTANDGNVFTPGASGNWNSVAVINSSVAQLYYWGWIAYMGEFGEFGYQIDCDAPVFSAGFAVTAEAGVVNAAAGVGADGASRMRIAISTAGLTAGVHTVNVLYKNAAGDTAALCCFKILIADDAGASATEYYSAEELVAMGAANATVTAADGYAHLVSTDEVGGKNDVKFTFTSDGFSDYVVIKYKTNSAGYGSNYDGYFLLNGVQFIGNRSKSDNWYEYYGDGEWHYLVLNLRKNKANSSAAANTDVVDGAALTTIEFVPFDYAGNKSGKNLADEYIDIAYIAFY